MTASSTKIGTFARTATAMASLGRLSSSTRLPFSTTTFAKNVSLVRSLMTARVTVPPSDLIADPSRSWVSGRFTGTFCIGIAMASASKWPIQIGRYRSPSFSLSMTTRL